MQSFFVKANGLAGSVKIEHADRVHCANNMYKGNDEKLEIPDNSYIKLRTEFNGYFDESVVRFVDNSDVSMDDEDVEKMYSYTPPLIFSFADNNEVGIPLAINSLPIPDENLDYMIPLGFVAKADGNYVIKAKSLNNLDFDQVYLVDNNNGSIVYTDLLNNEAYSFFISEGEYYGRFYLFTAPQNTDIEKVFNNSTTVNIYSYKQTVYISIPNIENVNGNVKIFDALGRNILTDVANSTFNEYQLNVSPGTYFVKYLTQNNTYFRKISIN